MQELIESPFPNTQSQVLVYVRLSDKRTAKVQIAQSLQLAQLRQIVEDNVRISVCDQILYINGERYGPMHTQMISLHENAIIHAYNQSQFVLDTDPFVVQFAWYNRNRKVYDQKTLVKKKAVIRRQISDCLRDVDQLQGFVIEGISVIQNCQEIDIDCTFGELGVAKQSGFIILIAEKRTAELLRNEISNQEEQVGDQWCLMSGECTHEGEQVNLQQIEGHGQEGQQQDMMKPYQISDPQSGSHTSPKDECKQSEQAENAGEQPKYILPIHAQGEKEQQVVRFRKRARGQNSIERHQNTQYSYGSTSPCLNFKKKNTNAVYKVVKVNSEGNEIWVSDSSSSDFNNKERLKAIVKKKQEYNNLVDLSESSSSCKEQRLKRGLSQTEKGELRWEFRKLFHSDTIACNSLQAPRISAARFADEEQETPIFHSQAQIHAKLSKKSGWRSLSLNLQNTSRLLEPLNAKDKSHIPTRDVNKQKVSNDFVEDD